ncbi:MAG TPA: hypothetical protein VJQ53_08170 [Candidatus Eisenbacteria bacterium]|nr:hypothetical protein [Candidatus Eisenbacteria bacterium]
MKHHSTQSMQHHSTRGIGVRFLIGLTLPVTGITLVLWTVVQLFIFQTSRI